jgi:hypothetical protein
LIRVPVGMVTFDPARIWIFDVEDLVALVICISLLKFLPQMRLRDGRQPTQNVSNCLQCKL